MQLACVEFARNVCGLPDAMTSEVDETTTDPVIDFMPDQRNLEMYGGTMRLGTYACTLEPESRAARAYGTWKSASAIVIGTSSTTDTGRSLKSTECALPGITRSARRAGRSDRASRDLHPWFVGTQAHPEFKSRPNRPSPLYRDFIGAALALGHERERRAPARMEPTAQVLT